MRHHLICLINWCISHKDQFTKYFFVGVSAALLDLASLYIASNILGQRPVFVVVVTQVLITAYAFLLNKHWSFQNKSPHGKQAIRFAILSTWNYSFGIAIMYIGNERLGVDHMIIRFITIGLAVTWNFLLYRYWVYKD